MRQLLLTLFLVAGIALSTVPTIQAQDAPPAPVVSDDAVNTIAKKLYCPVCENITLDTCGTAACADWRYEIRLQLEQGLTAEQITEDFVRRFGDRVVGTPLDPALRALSLLTPWIIMALGLGGAAIFFARRRPQRVPQAAAANAKATDRFHDLFESDISSS